MNNFYGWGSTGSGGNPFRTNSGNPFAISAEGSRSRGINQQDQPSGARASGGFGAPIEPPRGIRRNRGVNRQDVSTWGGTPDDPGASGGNPPSGNPPPWTGLYPGMPGNPALAPTSAAVAANPGQYAGTSFDPNLSARYTGTPGGANSLPTGSENVGGVGMYTGSNGPLDTTRFTPHPGQPQGPPPGSIPTGDPNTWVTPWGGTYNTPGSVNNTSQAEYDAYMNRAYGNNRSDPNNPYTRLMRDLQQRPGSVSADVFRNTYF